MEENPEVRRVLRIVLALEPAGIDSTSFEIALHLARHFDAELAGRLVEDIELMRAAALPFAREISLHSGEESDLAEEGLAQTLRAQEATLRELLAERTAEAGVRWSLPDARQHSLQAVLAGLGSGDVLVMGRPPRTQRSIVPPVRHVVLGSQMESDPRLMATVAALSSLAGREIGELLPWMENNRLSTALRAIRPSLVIAQAGADETRHRLLRDLLDWLDSPIIVVT